VIIINADDFGLSNNVNNAILDSFRLNYISSTTMIVNMKESFIEASNIVKSGFISPSSVGIHLNLEEGIPITENIKNLDFICDSNGKFSYSFRNKNRFYFDPLVCRIIKEELSEQIMLYNKTLFNLPTHIDSHNHTHTEFAVLKIIIDLAKDYGINKVRISRNSGVGISIKHKVYKMIYNSILRYNLKCTNYFGDIDDFNNVNFKSNCNYEIMVHPKYNFNNEIVDLDEKILFTKLQTLFKNKPPLLGSFYNL